MSHNSQYYSEDINEIDKIEFTVLPNKEVKEYSAVRGDVFGIDLPESYDEYEPKKGGLVDTRLGTCDMYISCTTCGQNYLNCPGHFGHTEFTEPMFHYNFMEHLKNVMQCVCLYCKKLLIDTSNPKLYEKYKKMSLEKRFKETRIEAKKANFCPHCGTPVPKIEIPTFKESNFNIKILVEQEIKSEVVNEESGTTDIISSKNKEDYLPSKCYNICRLISEEDCFFLGFDTSKFRPEDLVAIRYPIPPIIIRPSNKIDLLSSSTMEDSLTVKLSDIITQNKKLRDKKQKDSTDFKLEGYVADHYSLLLYHLVTYVDNDNKLPKSGFRGADNKNTKSVSQRLKSKEGRMRSNIMGKRVDFSARSVITPDPYINIDEIGIPQRIAVILTIPEEVTLSNINELTKLVRNGTTKYPGANYVKRRIHNGREEVEQVIDLKYRKKDIILNEGDIVCRHIVNGDYILFNRQPTLHKPSMMAHKIHVLKGVDTFRVNVSVVGPYNADFDKLCRKQEE